MQLMHNKITFMSETFNMKQNIFYTWKQFSQDYYREKAMAKTVASNLIRDGAKPFSLLNLDLHFISDSPN